MLNIEGHSGCDFKFIEVKNNIYLRKSTSNKGYISRLKKQALKQNEYAPKYFDIFVPIIVNEKEFDDKYYFDMEFYRSLDVFAFLDNCIVEDIDKFINKIFGFVDFQIVSSKNLNVKKEVVTKLKDIQKNLGNNHYSNFFKNYINDIFLEIDKVKNITLPVGRCHGDLTFSNILIQDDKIIFIDFLDSFIESPLLDISKLRQDTKHLWSFNLLKKEYDFTKLRIIMNYLDEKVNSYFKKYEFYRKYYILFQKINMLRIVPYAKDDKIIQYIKVELEKIEGENLE